MFLLTCCCFLFIVLSLLAYNDFADEAASGPILEPPQHSDQVQSSNKDQKPEADEVTEIKPLLLHLDSHQDQLLSPDPAWEFSEGEVLQFPLNQSDVATQTTFRLTKAPSTFESTSGKDINQNNDVVVAIGPANPS